jgi:uncharacterized membrane protein
MVTRKHRLAKHIDEEKIVQTIRAAEARTTGNILLVLSDGTRGDIMDAAARAFEKLRLHQTNQRNNVLFFVVPAKREFAVIGDAAIHHKLGQGFWNQLAAEMSEKIKAKDLTDGVVYGVEQAGRQLASHFPKP